MATSWVEICNLGLSALGSQPITAFPPTDVSQNAKLAQACYQMLADKLLTAHDWACAEARQALDALTAAPADTDWKYQFQQPIDCLKVRGISPKAADYVRTGRLILCNEPAITLIYTCKITDPTLLDPAVAAAIGALIAYHLTYKIAQKRELRQDMRVAFREAFIEAEWADEKGKKKVSDSLPTTNRLQDQRLEEIG
jgi:hypothetical protein